MAKTDDLPVYILAVSGGVDSMVMAETIGKMRTRKCVIAHFNHGIREESDEDEAFVRAYAKRRNVPYMTHKSELGPGASEDAAREARYKFLRNVQSAYRAVGIVTAHHQDDVIETMCINLIRGTGWRGMVSLRSHEETVRPLLGISKAQIVAYAIKHNIDWVEDRTNEDPRYLRNYVRQTIMRKMSAEQRRKFIEIYEAQLGVAQKIFEETEQLHDVIHGQEGLSRHMLIMTPENVAQELLQSLTPKHLERPQLSRLLHFARAAKPGKELTVAKGLHAKVTEDELVVYTP